LLLDDDPQEALRTFMAINKPQVSVILPTYNEAGNIIELVNQIRQFLEVNGMRGEVVIVDDSSPDKTGEMAESYFSKIPEVRVIIRKERGLATAIKRGIEEARGQVIAVMDADFNHEPRLVPELVKKVDQADLVIGSRFVSGGGMSGGIRKWASKIFNRWWVQPLTGNGVTDNLSGFFAMKGNRLKGMEAEKIFYGYGDYFMRLIYYARQSKLKISELPLYHSERRHGKSKSNLLKMLVEYSWAAGRLRRTKRHVKSSC
jgi:dolichol-phosphate mannosyltransferase